MAQSFVTTYRNHYRRHDLHPNPSAKPKDLYDGAFPKEEMFHVPEPSNVEEMDPKDVDIWIRDLYLKRYWTTYRLAYCPDMIKEFKKGNRLYEAIAASAGEEDSFENELLEYCRNLYEPMERPKIPEPLPGTRKLFGYIRPSRNYTPLTNYQYYIGKTGYNILKGDHRRDADRLSLQDPKILKKSDVTNKNAGDMKKSNKSCECYCVKCRNSVRYDG